MRSANSMASCLRSGRLVSSAVISYTTPGSRRELGSVTPGGTSSRTSGDLPKININKTTGTLTLTNTLRTSNNWTYTQGDIDAGTSTVVFADPGAGGATISGSHQLENVTFDTNSASARTWTIAAGTVLEVDGTLLLDNTSTGATSIDTGTLAVLGSSTTVGSTINGTVT